LAALDAVVWLALGVVAALRSPVPGRVVGAVLIAVLLIAAAFRLRRAIWLNHRYRFTTWRWGRAWLALLLFGLLVQWTLRT